MSFMPERAFRLDADKAYDRDMEFGRHLNPTGCAGTCRDKRLIDGAVDVPEPTASTPSAPVVEVDEHGFPIPPADDFIPEVSAPFTDEENTNDA